MKSKCDRLCGLQMGEAGHDHIGMAGSFVDQRRLHIRQGVIHRIDRIAHP